MLCQPASQLTLAYNLLARKYLIPIMSEEERSSSAGNNNTDSSILLTKDGQTYYVDKSGVVDSRNVVTPQESDSNVFSYDMDDADEESDVLDTSDPRYSAASPEELSTTTTKKGSGTTITFRRRAHTTAARRLRPR
ncbi:hypothetical protein J4Q44_G00130090 [Coregonus suidteri]|uniref:Uncharacterized protein n=1 Tax=Coregonus suidteri TaxID=861788 RepID=A0AAN8LWH5_9TELE